jgi:hypothetical protein
MTKAARLPFVIAGTLAAASCGDLQLASCALAAPAPAVMAAAPSAPSSPLDRLEQLDQLHADLELAKLRAAIAKANAEARDAVAGPGVGAAGGPPMPQLAPNGPGFSFPPMAPPGPSTGKGKAKAELPESPLFTLVEAWGAGAERRAIIHSDAGDRLVRVGDQIALGIITAIGGGAVTYRDAQHRTHTID